ncbi:MULTISPECIES: hypothetical protein [Xanthobacter]|uniref:hypothetical protein n=1 Tax=Xanthobacter TaxID=279 RepID=UPI001F384ACB|nr:MULTISPECIES: hypothetical protein [unclassified Xanthobacter]
MRSRIGARGRAAALAVLAGAACGIAVSAHAADLYGRQPVTKAPAGGDYQGCGNCAAQAPAPAPAPGGPFAIGIANAPVVVGAVPPPVYYAQPPRVYLYPVPQVNVQGPVGPLAAPPPGTPRSCWVTTSPGGAGFWASPC